MSSHTIERRDVERLAKRDTIGTKKRYGKNWEAWLLWDRRIAQYAAGDAEPSPTNTYPPSWDATGQIITFVRDPNRFALNSYCKFRPATAMQGLYLYLDGDQAARVVDEAAFDWADGAERPRGNDQLAEFRFEPYMCQRKDYPYTIGNLTRKQCPWSLEAAQAAIVMQQAITLRTMRVVRMLEDEDNWGDNADSADALNDGAGPWDASDPDLLAIRKSINQSVLNVNKATNGMVHENQLRLVISPESAKPIGESKEMSDYVESSVWAKSTIEGNLFNRNRPYNLPPVLYGVETTIEDAVRVSSRKGAASATKGYVKSASSAVLCAMVDSLPGDQVGAVPVPNFSTFQIFHYEGLLKVTSWEDVRNERMEGHVSEIFTEKMVAPAAGYLIQDILSPAA